MGMQFWLPGVFDPVIWTVVKWQSGWRLEFRVNTLTCKLQETQVYADGPAYLRTHGPR
jgi:hypothetical protein